MINKEDMAKLDINLIKNKLTDLATDTISGEVETLSVPITMDIPIQMHAILTHMADVTGASLESMVKKIASINMKNELSKIKNMTDLPVEEPTKSMSDLDNLGELGSKMEGIQKAMSQFGEMSKTLENLQKVAEVIEKKNG